MKTKVGAKLASASWAPNSPATTVSARKKTPIAPQAVSRRAAPEERAEPAGQRAPAVGALQARLRPQDGERGERDDQHDRRGPPEQPLRDRQVRALDEAVRERAGGPQQGGDDEDGGAGEQRAATWREPFMCAESAVAPTRRRIRPHVASANFRKSRAASRRGRLRWRHVSTQDRTAVLRNSGVSRRNFRVRATTSRRGQLRWRQERSPERVGTWTPPLLSPPAASNATTARARPPCTPCAASTSTSRRPA